MKKEEAKTEVKRDEKAGETAVGIGNIFLSMFVFWAGGYTVSAAWRNWYGDPYSDPVFWILSVGFLVFLAFFTRELLAEGWHAAVSFLDEWKAARRG